MFFNALLRQRVKERVSCRRGKRMMLVDQSSDMAAGRTCARWTGLVLVIVFVKFVIVVIVLAHVRDGGLHPRAV